MDRIKLRKFERILAIFNYFIGTIAIGLALLMATSFVSKKLFYWLSHREGFIIYAIVVIAIALRNAIHFYRWYVRSHPINLHCSQCHTNVLLSRYKEQEVLSSPVRIYVETFRFQFIRLKQNFYWIAYRPYLQLECSECGEKQIICPYCHEPISQESVECHYNKPSKCPHCGKKIYTTLPLQESDDLIKIKEY